MKNNLNKKLKTISTGLMAIGVGTGAVIGVASCGSDPKPAPATETTVILNPAKPAEPGPSKVVNETSNWDVALPTTPIYKMPDGGYTTNVSKADGYVAPKIPTAVPIPEPTEGGKIIIDGTEISVITTKTFPKELPTNLYLKKDGDVPEYTTNVEDALGYTAASTPTAVSIPAPTEGGKIMIDGAEISVITTKTFPKELPSNLYLKKDGDVPEYTTNVEYALGYIAPVIPTAVPMPAPTEGGKMIIDGVEISVSPTKTFDQEPPTTLYLAKEGDAPEYTTVKESSIGYQAAVQFVKPTITNIEKDSVFELPSSYIGSELDAVIPHLSVAVSNASVLTLSNGETIHKPILGELMFNPDLISGALIEVPAYEHFQNKSEQKWVMTYNEIPLHIQYFENKKALDAKIAATKSEFNSQNLPTWYTQDQEIKNYILFDGKETGLTINGKFSSETALSILIANLKNLNNNLFIKVLNQEWEYQLPIEFWDLELDAIIPHLSVTVANGSDQHAPFSSVLTMFNGETIHKPILGELMFNPDLISGALIEVPDHTHMDPQITPKWVMTYNEIPLHIQYFDTKEALDAKIAATKSEFNSHKLPTWYTPPATGQETIYKILFDGKETGLTINGKLLKEKALSELITSYIKNDEINYSYSEGVMAKKEIAKIVPTPDANKVESITVIDAEGNKTEYHSIYTWTSIETKDLFLKAGTKAEAHEYVTDPTLAEGYALAVTPEVVIPDANNGKNIIVIDAEGNKTTFNVNVQNKWNLPAEQKDIFLKAGATAEAPEYVTDQTLAEGYALAVTPEVVIPDANNGKNIIVIDAEGNKTTFNVNVLNKWNLPAEQKDIFLKAGATAEAPEYVTDQTLAEGYVAAVTPDPITPEALVTAAKANSNVITIDGTKHTLVTTVAEDEVINPSLSVMNLYLN